jgi:CRP-like cAMP-binding protein
VWHRLLANRCAIEAPPPPGANRSHPRAGVPHFLEMGMALTNDLARLAIFEGLSPQQLQRLARIAAPLTVLRGRVVFRQGDPADGFYGIGSGRVKLYRMTPDGRQQVLHFFGAGDVFGEAAVFTGSTFPAFARALAETRLIHLPKRPFIEAVRQDPQLALNMLATLSQYLRRFADMIEELSLRAVSARLARYLVELADRAGRPAQGGIVVELTTTKSELAARLGTVSETLSRTLGRFRDRGLVKVQGKSIAILDRLALEALASESE